MPPIRLAYVVHTFDMGGLERFVANMLNSIDRSRFEPTLICIRRTGTAESWLNNSDTRIIELNKPPGRMTWAFIQSYRRQLRELSTQIVHTHNWGTLWETSLARGAVKGLRHVHAERGTVLGGSTNTGIRRSLSRMALRLGLERCHQVLAVDDAVADRVYTTCGFRKERIRIIPNGVPVPSCPDRESSRRQVRGELGIPADAIVVGSIGRLHRVKGFDYAISAIQELKDHPRRVDLLLVGEGHERTELEKLAGELGVRERIHFAGKQPQIGNYLAALDIFINSSRSEGMSQSIIEAMGFGLPLVVADVGGNSQLVAGGEPCGIVAAPESPRSLAQGIRALLDSPQMAKQFADSGATRAEEKHSLAAMVSTYEDLYEQLTANKSPGANS